MKVHEIALLFILGWVIWVLGTIYYGYRGPQILETTTLRYWISFVLSPILSAAICIAILNWRRIPRASWAPAMLLLAIPGMIGEAVVLSSAYLHAQTAGHFWRPVRGFSVRHIRSGSWFGRGGHTAGGFVNSSLSAYFT